MSLYVFRNKCLLKRGKKPLIQFLNRNFVIIYLFILSYMENNCRELDIKSKADEQKVTHNNRSTT